MREDTRRSMLAEVAPVFILNEWTEPPPLPVGVEVQPLPDLHPLAARGVMSFLNDAKRRVPRGVMNAVRPHIASIAARAEEL